jgi:hypothetical protein
MPWTPSSWSTTSTSTPRSRSGLWTEA